MKLKPQPFFLFLVLLTSGICRAEEAPPLPDRSVMSDAFWQLWNDEVQKEMDARIEKYRKADAVVALSDVKPNSEIQVEQISHTFIFGAHIFNFDQLGSDERNARYKALYGTLFNSATIAFYWQKFEPQPGECRFQPAEIDSSAFWNRCRDPNAQPFWRRPPTDPVVEFCKSKGIRLHGHTIVWGNRTWQHPAWLWSIYTTPEEKKALDIPKDELYKRTPAEIYAMSPPYIDAMERHMLGRIPQLAKYYGNRLDSWDVVNESSIDYHGNVETGDKVCKSAYGLMPADYTLKAFRLATKHFPPEVKLNINDYASTQNYVNQVKDLRAKGCKIDIMGSQMHLFNPQQTLDVAAGKATSFGGSPPMTPEGIWETFETLSQAGLPIHLSEITITAPNDDKRGREIQANVLRNFYRMWFSIPQMMGITLWNVVDGCGAPGEPTTSGLFTRDMQPKASYFALKRLVEHEWKTCFAQIADTPEVTLKFRGFKGRYQVRWTDKDGNAQCKEIVVE